MLETLYLTSVPGMKEKILTAKNENVKDAVDADKLDFQCTKYYLAKLH